jgi:DNA polymerase-3 subunit alpha
VEYTPLLRAQKGGISTQYSMGPIEELGLLKMDFLGLSNLTIINNTLRIVRKVYNVSLATSEIPLDDAKTFELLGLGDTTGVFQLESAGMKRYLKELKPNSFDDIIAMCALYRPGPMQWIDDFVERKHGRRDVSYMHPKMEQALRNTYGILVYQEQVMQITKELCGFTGGQADTMRKAIGKKKPEVMAKMKQDFIEGAIKTSGADRRQMEEFWAQLEAFAAYCFPKAHAACYAMIAYQTAYLKAHYPSAFMAALMTSDYGNIDRIAIEVAECRRMGIEVLPPDVNQSFAEFGITPESQAIRFGLLAVKNVGLGGIEAILEARKADGPFKTVEEFAKRVNAAEVNKKVWESLIKCGAMDSLGERGQLLHNVDSVTSYATKAQKNALTGQIDIFGSLGIEEELPALRLEIPPVVVTGREQLAWERELLGLYLSHHPLDDYDDFLGDRATPIAEVTTDMEGKSLKLGGIITTVRRIMTKSNQPMAFVGLEDKTGELELIVFPKAYEANPDAWQTDQVVMVAGKVNTKDRDGRVGSELKLMVDQVKILDYDKVKGSKTSTVNREPSAVTDNTDSVIARSPSTSLRVNSATKQSQPEPTGRLTITLADFSDTGLLMRIKDILSRTAGESEVYLVLAGEAGKTLRLPFKVKLAEEFLKPLRDLVGTESVEITSLEAA